MVSFNGVLLQQSKSSLDESMLCAWSVGRCSRTAPFSGAHLSPASESNARKTTVNTLVNYFSCTSDTCEWGYLVRVLELIIEFRVLFVRVLRPQLLALLMTMLKWYFQWMKPKCEKQSAVAMQSSPKHLKRNNAFRMEIRFCHFHSKESFKKWNNLVDEPNFRSSALIKKHLQNFSTFSRGKSARDFNFLGEKQSCAYVIIGCGKGAALISGTIVGQMGVLCKTFTNPPALAINLLTRRIDTAGYLKW